MTNDERDIQHKLRVLQRAEKIGNARAAISAVKSATGKGSLPGRPVRKRAKASIWDDRRCRASSSVAAAQTPAANIKYGFASHWDGRNVDQYVAFASSSIAGAKCEANA